MIIWRNANMPGVPIWVTEWGWDAARPGETCGKSTECVSQLAQAAYGVRGLSLLARKGVAASHWFFYASECSLPAMQPEGDTAPTWTCCTHWGLGAALSMCASDTDLPRSKH